MDSTFESEMHRDKKSTQVPKISQVYYIHRYSNECRGKNFSLEWITTSTMYSCPNVEVEHATKWVIFLPKYYIKIILILVI